MTILYLFQTRISLFLKMTYLRNLDDHGLKHEVIYLDIILNQSSGNCTTNNGRNNETKDHNLIYAIDCIIRISLLVPISLLNNIINYKYYQNIL